MKQKLKFEHYLSWVESTVQLGLKTLCGTPQRIECHVQVTIRIHSTVKIL